MNKTPIEDRKLLYRDLCARKPYGVKVQLMNAPAFGDAEPIFSPKKLSSYKLDMMEVWAEGSNVSRLFKPYLFPLSSMTREQVDEFYETLRPVILDSLQETYEWKKHQEEHQLSDERPVTLKSIMCETTATHWMLEHHFDIDGLIPKDLAIDATGKDIY